MSLALALSLTVSAQDSEARFEVELASFNSKASDFGSAFYGEGVVFSSDRDSSVVVNRRHLSNGKRLPFYQLFSSKAGDSSSLKMNRDVNKKYHESTVSISKDGNTMYFTRSNYYKGSFKTDDKGTNHLKIYKATKEDGLWSNVEELPFNSDQYSVAHPALNDKEDRLYFASDMPGSIGGSDIYYVSISDTGYGAPQNMGSVINTSGNDTFPFMSSKGDLYFSSDGHSGKGGLDVFVSPKEEDYTTIYNLGLPVNTSSDDFGFIINDENKKGFLTSNREGGLGGDDIYTILETSPLKIVCEGMLSGTVTDENGVAIYGATIILKDKEGVELSRINSDAKGIYSFPIDCNNVAYTVLGEQKAYESDSETVTVTRKEKDQKVALVLKSEEKPVVVGTDLAKELKLNPIYFDTGKATIRPDAALELDKVIAYMNKHPEVKVEVRSHTDSRGSSSSNLRLSDRRAKSTAKYIADHSGFSLTRISGKGFGESQLLNHCKNGVKCSNEEHQINRRSEFIVISK